MATAPKDGDKTRGKSAVVVSMADAARDLARQKRRRDDPNPHEPRNDVLPGKWTANNLGLPSEVDCPVTPLGIEGRLYHLIDSSGQFCSLEASEFTHSGIQSLFHEARNWPKWAWPRYGKPPAPVEGQPQLPPPIKSFDDDHAREALFQACARKQLFSPSNKLRGRGAWSTDGGGLIFHAGEELWSYDAVKGRPVLRETGMLQGHLYPRLPALPSPWTEAIRPQDNPARELLEGFRRWHWERPDVDPVLMLGWLGTAYLGGALKWRSAVLLVGDRETGKSTLQEVLKELFGDALFHAADTTAAGIYQKMGHDTRPVAVDELEANADARKVDAVVTLMRAASSGAFARRGGQSGSPTEYQMRSAFLFSAINNPVHAAQDLSRLAILRLRPLEKDQTGNPLVIDAETCGRKILAVLLREWPRFGETFTEYRRALAAGGHTNRGQDTYGTLLAMADLLLGAELGAELGVALTEAPEWWAEHLAADGLSEIEDAKANWRDCLEHLLGNRVDVWRHGARATVGQLLEDLKNANNLTPQEATRDLGLTGLGLLIPGEIAPQDCGWVLAIPNSSPLVAGLFNGRPWQHGGWKDALRQGPAEVFIGRKDVNRVKINGVQTRCTLVVMGRFEKLAER